MSQHEQPPEPLAGPLASPWTVLGVGLGLVGGGWVWGVAADATAPALRALVLALGLVGVGAALVLYARRAAGLEGRLTLAGLWMLGAVALYATRQGLGTHFDSFGVLLTAFTAAAFVAGLITALPARWRMVGGSLLVLLHFAAILTAVTIVPPPNGQSPYLSNHLFSRVSRPYLQMTVLNNGYHFYAPEPGPAALVWFYVEFADGETTWVRIPDHKTVGSQIERRRLGALATSLEQSMPAPRDFDALRQRRVEAGEKHKPPIPMADMPIEMQYHEPSNYVRILISSFVRRVVATVEHPKGASSDVVGVKVYRVNYYNPPVQHFQAGRAPLDPTLYAVYYVGEHDARGKMKETSYKVKRDNEDGPVVERIQDPYLFWQIPIVLIPDDPDAAPEVGPRQRDGDPGTWRSEGRIINYVRIHAGDKKDQESIP